MLVLQCVRGHSEGMEPLLKQPAGCVYLYVRPGGRGDRGEGWSGDWGSEDEFGFGTLNPIP